MTRGRSLRAKDPPGPPGQRLKALREALGISGRDVQTYSLLIARSQGNKKYCISHSSLVEIENSTRIPSVHKLFTLSALSVNSLWTLGILVEFSISTSELWEMQYFLFPCERAIKRL